MAAAGTLGSLIGLACGFAASFFRLHRLYESSAGVGAVSFGIVEVALVILLVGAGVAGLLVHAAFAQLTILSSAQRFAPVAAAAIGAGLIACWAR